jgi:DNA processing protein
LWQPRIGFDMKRASNLKCSYVMKHNASPALARRTISSLSKEYPSALRDLRDPPPLLSVEGFIDFDSCAVLGVVGARDSSVMAESWMRRNLPDLAKVALIVSGGARGIDELAHQIAMFERRPTAVVLPSSLDCPYPTDWSHRRSQVVDCGGCFISEYEPGTQIRRSHFEKRNRLIAALSDVVLVVEARRRSGTAITARHAGKIGRTVATLPWFPSDPRGELCNDLIFGKDALLVRNADDVAELLKSAVATRAMRMQRVMPS